MITRRRPRRRLGPRSSRRVPADSADGSSAPLAGFGHPHLAPAGWAVGRPLHEIARQPLTTAEATAVTLAVLAALEELHRTGRHHGGVGIGAIGVGLDGWVRLAAEQASVAGDAAEDLRATGRLLCDLLGARAEAVPGTPATEAERSAPALVAVARRLARGSGWSVSDAWSAVQGAAGFCGTEPQLVKALAALGDRASGGTEVERAVTRVMLGPPLAGRDAAAPPRPRIERARLGLRLPQTASRWTALFGSLLLAGVVLGGGLALLAARPAAANASSPVSTAHRAAGSGPANQKPAQTAAPFAGVDAQTPTAAVTTFFRLVQAQRLDQAALLWTSRMAGSVDLRSRFGGVQSITLQRDDAVATSLGQGSATVAIDWVETDSDGTVHEYSGTVYLASGPLVGRWDGGNGSVVVQAVAPGAPGGAGGDGGDGG